MKRENHLYGKVMDIDNLRLADTMARRGKAHSYGVRRHDRNREENLLALRGMLERGDFATSPYTTFTITESKKREIFRLPYYPDRILHHAIMNVLEPIWTSIFTRDTYSCIKGRGIHACAQAVKDALRQDVEGTQYCLKLDIRKFYPSIDHEILKKIIRRRLKDARLLSLLDGIIDSVPSGVPIGNYLSQYFANLYLAYFDHWLKEAKGVKHYFRYADDMVILSSDKEALHSLLCEIRRYLRDELRLKVKPNWQVFPVETRGIDFVGYVFRHGITRLRKSIKVRMCRKIARVNRYRRPLNEHDYRQALCSWWGWLVHCNGRQLYKKLQKSLRYDIRSIAKRKLRHDRRRAVCATA